MIKRIHDLVERLAREHKLVNTFKYEMLSKSAGSGEDITPLVFLEMPIYFNNMVTLGGVIKATFNIDIVLNPQALHNYEIPQLTGADCQQIASQIAQQFIARMRNLYLNQESSIEVADYSIMTLQRWYDDASYGVRLTVRANLENEINFCMDDDYFDPTKEFTEKDILPKVDTNDSQGCVSLGWKLPQIDL
jgi:hypothetical protein